MASRISSSLTATKPSTNSRMCANVRSPTRCARSASAMVRPVSSGSHATGRPARWESRASAASSGSTPMTLISGRTALTAAATPAMSPPPLTGTSTTPASGRSRTISRPTVPW